MELMFYSYIAVCNPDRISSLLLYISYINSRPVLVFTSNGTIYSDMPIRNVRWINKMDYCVKDIHNQTTSFDRKLTVNISIFQHS